MKNAIRWFPSSVGTFLLGFYVGSPVFAQATHTAKLCVGGAIVIATVIATGFLCAITRSKQAAEAVWRVRLRHPHRKVTRLPPSHRKESVRCPRARGSRQ